VETFRTLIVDPSGSLEYQIPCIKQLGRANRVRILQHHALSCEREFVDVTARREDLNQLTQMLFLLGQYLLLSDTSQYRIEFLQCCSLSYGKLSAHSSGQSLRYRVQRDHTTGNSCTDDFAEYASV
jgi:hypothetical protein